METPTTLQQAIKYFSDLDNCQRYMIAVRWADGQVRCPSCGSEKVAYLANARLFKCYAKHPRQKFSLKVGTIFEDSPLGMDKWMMAIWLIANCKNGISSCELARDLGITQKSAWHMLQRIRLAMRVGSFEKLGGQIEVDETYIGGKARFMHKSRREAMIKGRGSVGKVAVMGLLERNGKVRAKVIGNTTRETLYGEVREHVEAGAELFTDQFAAYRGLEQDYIHNVINHAEKYVDGNVHTCNIDNFWSLLKRGIKGTYVSVEPFHLFRYLDEQSFRFNNRKLTDGERFSIVVDNIIGRRLTYSELTGKEGSESHCPPKSPAA
jgi:transposase-like protein